ncbi:2'-5' RNA ligase family protein [Phycicoccus sp. CSK15P-2]|uniref:2'-5' RNA ligase family protein n=1 Tax=Phycicoccus sp. CSK15P-2 TaxID=2807627 RepID=UPI00194F16C5|nr:2'-5' RNA ligase family protein [Phycicoccus sp. CSK15P-2]MBM6402844.1 2'-5' RNA ligase family protein [Phycicoccus sp. CSK15P-2]
MHHVDLLLDAEADAAVRARWQTLTDAGLPSQGRHPSPSNRPHVTMSVTRDWPDDFLVDAARTRLGALPLRARLGPLLVMGSNDRFVLAWAVVVGEDVLEMHRHLLGLLGSSATPHTAPGHWVPHVTLARLMDPEQVASALRVLAADEREVSLVAARHWDSEAKSDDLLAGPMVSRTRELAGP